MIRRCDVVQREPVGRCLPLVSVVPAEHSVPDRGFELDSHRELRSGQARPELADLARRQALEEIDYASLEINHQIFSLRFPKASRSTRSGVA